MAGYFNDQEATDRAIVDGWFHSVTLPSCTRMGT